MEKYLLRLLNEVKTIIIPGLGALTVTNQNTGEIMFMPYLKYDDGKLVGFIANNDNISVDAAKTYVTDQVQNIINSLNNSETYNLKNFGSFFKGSDGEIEFKSSEEKFSNESIEEPILPIEVNQKFTQNNFEENPPLNVEFETEIVDDNYAAIELNNNNVFDASNEDKIVDLNTIEVEETNNINQTLQPSEEHEEESLNDASVEIQEVKRKGIFGFLKKRKVTSVKESIQENQDEESSNHEIGVELNQNTIDDNSDIEFENSKNEENESTESLEVNDSIDIEDNIVVKKRKGFKFWFLSVFTISIILAGVYVGINFDSFKNYIPLISKSNKTNEKEIIKKLESDPTKPSLSKNNKSEELLKTSESEKNMKEVISKKDEVIKKEDEIPNQSEISANLSNNKSKTTPVKKNISTESSSSFFIILGTFSEQVNAKNLVDKLSAEGKSSVGILDRGGDKYSVIFGSYSSKEDAVSKLSDAKSISQNAWIFHK